LGLDSPEETPPFQPQVLACFEKERLTVAVRLPEKSPSTTSVPVLVELVTTAGDRLGAMEKEESQGTLYHRFEFKAKKTDVDKLRLRVSCGDRKAELPLARALLIKGHETALSIGAEFYTASQASLLCTVQGVRSLSESVPLPGSEVVVRLRDQAGKSHQLYKGQTDGSGQVSAAFEIPALTAGDYTLEVQSRSLFGKEKLERKIQLKSDAKILLVTDKPIYQPGQLMHLRALVLRPFDMRPVAARDLLFEVEDPKGNKVFKRTLQTSAYGVASVDFQLADEVNMGDYHLRAVLGEVRAEKTVGVKRYVLPKFKVEVKADKTFYLPKETIKAELQSDYFFGKPVAQAQVEVTASTFDVAFRKFHSWKGTTDANGHAKFEMQLPDYFVGQPLQQGNALVKLDVKVHDSAEHTEAVVKSYTVSEQPIRVSLIPAGGKLVPDLDNRLFAAAVYPDGSPVPNCEIRIWHDKKAKPTAKDKLVEPLAIVKTNAAGLTELTLKPRAEQFRSDKAELQNIEFLGGRQQFWRPQIVFELRAEARDARGNKAVVRPRLTSHPLGENVLLRLDKAVYQTGDRMHIDIRSSAGLPTVFVDIVRGGQIMLSRWLTVKDGQARQQLDLPPSVFGSLEVHAYQMLAHGEIIRDSRVAYVQPQGELKIDVKADKAEHEPGTNGRIRFQVTDQAGKPTPAALGIIVVDEAIYALQDLQPGLEKVYFTLQEELLKPHTQIHFSPGDTIDNIVRQAAVPAPKQQIAEVLLTAVKLPPPPQWHVNPGLARQQQVEQQLRTLVGPMFQYAWQQQVPLQFDKAAGRWIFPPTLLDRLVRMGYLQREQVFGVLGEKKLDLNAPSWADKGFTPDAFGRAITAERMVTLMGATVDLINQQRGKYRKGGKWILPGSILADAYAAQSFESHNDVDAWGAPLRLVRRDDTSKPWHGQSQFAEYDIASAGPDGKLGTADDLLLSGMAKATNDMVSGDWWLHRRVAAGFFAGGGMMGLGGIGGIGGGLGGGFALQGNAPLAPMLFPGLDRQGRLGGVIGLNGGFNGFGGLGGLGGGLGGMMGGGMMGMGGGFGMIGAGPPPPADAFLAHAVPGPQAGAAGPGQAPPVRVREYFPETMLWQPALITDDNGNAELSMNFADSITTWRLSASANSLGGALGGATVPLKVFQDFFVDIDLPVILTQHDEVAFPVAVYNYLKTPQTVKLDLQAEPWFELLDNAGLSRTLELKPNEVTSVKYRIRAQKIGMQPLLVKAHGSHKSDAVKRVVEVVPNGQKFETVVTDRLSGHIRQSIDIPASALPEASKMLVRIYPGVMAQVIDGLDGMLRMPCGCFEQTSSSAYPNIMIVDYIKKNRLTSPQMLMQAEQYLNVGYQRLLTFERPGGGFDWWGREEPLVWLSAYGLQEFNDMAKVYPIDRGIIDRTRAFLMKKRDADGTWSSIGATHGETIERMGHPRLLLTSYVTWSLLESGYAKEQLKSSVEFIRTNLAAAGDNAYILALAANALAAYDVSDAGTLQALRKLDSLRRDVKEWRGAACFPSSTTSLSYAHGDCATIETTALAALAMVKTGQFTSSVNQALTYLTKMKSGQGTWGSTQATILALKALVAGTTAQAPGEPVHFTLKVNGKEAARGRVDAENAEMLQTFEIKDFHAIGRNQVEIETTGATNLMYQIVGRHYQSWQRQEAPVKPSIEVDVSYDRTKLSTNDLLHAKATLKYHGTVPTYMVMLDLGIAPGFTVEAGDFAEMVGKGQVKKFSVTARQVTLYLGDVKPGDVLTFEYSLRPRFPLRARTAPSVAYEYNAPANRAEAQPVELVVEEHK
jgi:hypothetical protein